MSVHLFDRWSDRFSGRLFDHRCALPALPALPAAAAAALCFTLTAAAAQAASPSGPLTLQFVEPARFADAGLGEVDRDRNLKTLADFLQRQAAQLPAGQTLHLAVLNVDLAGELRLGGVHDTRVLRGRTDWPRIKLRYTLSSGGAVVRQGTASLAALDYLESPTGHLEHLGALPHEKRMLQTWFRQTFLTP